MKSEKGLFWEYFTEAVLDPTDPVRLTSAFHHLWLWLASTGPGPFLALLLWKARLQGSCLDRPTSDET